MPRQKAFVSELGTISEHYGEFRAQFTLRNNEDTQVNIYGPSRATEEEAQEDLEQIRKAGAVGKDRGEGLEIMAAEAQRIKITAQYQSQIQETLQRRTSMETIEESDYEDDDVSEQSDPPWIQASQQPASWLPTIRNIGPGPAPKG